MNPEDIYAQLQKEIAERERLEAVITVLEEQIHDFIDNEIFEQIERAKQEWETTVDSLSQLIFLLDRQGHILRANRTVEQWRLARVEAVPSCQVHALLHPHCQHATCYLQNFWQQAWPAAKNGQASEIEAEDKILNRYLKLQIYPISTQTKRKNKASNSFAVVFIHDITTEHNLRQHLQQQERLAAVGQLAGGIAHYFNNILTVIIGLAELCSQEAETPATIKNDLLEIIKEGQRAAKLTHQFLDFSRRSLSRKVLVDLASVVNEFTLDLKQSAPKNIDIKTEIGAVVDSYPVEVDLSQLKQVFKNLANNAIEAMPSGGVLTFYLTRFELKPNDTPPCPDVSAGNWVTLAIIDTGAGISKKYLPHLFEPFFSTKGLNRAAGLGLAQAYGIIKQHGGEICVESKPGRGATFTLYFPAATG
jgi:signal transduction histidine kinase